jgi:long-chain acyl-CoA synthetase
MKTMGGLRNHAHPDLANPHRNASSQSRDDGRHFITSTKNSRPLRDFNFEMDPQAYATIPASDVPLVLAPGPTAADLETLRRSSAAMQWIYPAASDWLKFWKSNFDTDGFNPFDTPAVAYVTSPGQLLCEDPRVAIQVLPDDAKPDAATKSYLLAGPDIDSQRSVRYCYQAAPQFKAGLLALSRPHSQRGTITEMNVVYCLRRAARYHGDNIAIHHEGARVTYRDFAAQVATSARKLDALGAAKRDRVAVLMLNSPAYLDLYYSTALAGAIVVPLNTRWHLNEIVFTLNDSDSKLLFVDRRFAPLVAEIRERVPSLERIIFYDEGACPEGLTDFRNVAPSTRAAFDEPHEDDISGLFYTSGATGGPKGAMLTHRNVYSNALHGSLAPFELAALSPFLHVAPMFHLADAGAIHSLTLHGLTHCFLSAFDPRAVLEAIERYRIENLVLVPTMINAIVNHPSIDDYDHSSLRRVSYGASPMPLPLLKHAMDKLRCDFIQGCGMTEVAALLTALAPEDHTFDDCDRDFAPIKSAGRAVVGVEIRVVDDHDRDVPVGCPGEVLARGPNVMKGYWKRPELSAEALRGGWMHTGDIGALDERGFLYILDRKKDMIKTGGENVYSPEVESVVCSHPAVLEAAVIGAPDDRWGEIVHAVVVARPGASLTASDLIAYCRERLTHFKCPTSVAFADALPKGGTGKVQKSALRERYLSAQA